MLKIKITRVKPKVPEVREEPTPEPKSTRSGNQPSQEELVELLSEIEKQETLEFPINYEGIDQGISLLQDQRLEFLELGDPKQPLSLLTVYRLRYLSSANGEYFELRPFTDDGKPGNVEKFVNPQELKNALANRMKLMKKHHPKMRLAEIAHIDLKLFGHCW